jgi:hypothetical protein
MTSPTSDRRQGLVGNTPIKAPVNCATTANIILSGEQVVDGVQTASSRVLVKNQTDPTQNGIYDTNSAAWTRSLDADGNYDLVCGSLVYVTGGTTQSLVFYTCTTANPITIGTSAITWAVSVAAGNLTAQLASTTSAALGAGLSGFNPTLNYVAGTIGQHLGVEWNPQDYPWLAKFDGATDDTAALLACLTAIYNAGGGTMRLPRGTTMVSSLVFNFAASKSVLIRGAGRQATFIKSNGGTSPVLNISANSGVLDVYSEFSDFTIDGAAKTVGRHGLQLTTIANVKTNNLGITNCDTGLNSLGCLVSNHHNPSWNANNTGFACTKSGAIYANMVNFFGGCIKQNSSWGVNLDSCSNIQYWGTDIESNGTTANLSTGQIQTATTIAAETGFSQLLFIGCWLESGLGQPINIQAAAGLHVNFTNCKAANSQGGRVMSVGAISSISLIHLEAASPGDTVTLAAANSYIEGGVINTITDTSTNQMRVNVPGSSASLGTFIKSAQIGTGGMTLDTSAVIRDNTGTFTQGTQIAQFRDGGLAGNALGMFATNGSGGNAAACAFRIGAHGVNSRSLNAGGSLNASGADYAEYETKRDDCGTLSAGQVVGFDAAGLLTDKFALAVGFGVKSTAPAMVGGDVWFNESPPNEPPPLTTSEPVAPSVPPPDADAEALAEHAAAQAVYGAALSAYNAELAAHESALSTYQAALEAFEAAMEAARQKVDRIAYTGKVPVNVQGAAPGQFILAADDGAGGIKGIPSGVDGPTCVGRVRTVLPDGRAQLVVRAV